MNQRNNVAAVLGIVAAYATPCRSLAVDGPSVSSRPNVILIMADDVGREAFGCYGGEGYATPNLDRLAEGGMRFTHCYSQPLCTPSRVKIMTGQSNVRNYTRFSILDRDEKTIGHVLKRAGYKTAVAGKWQLYGAEHYGPLAGTGTHPRDAGFDEYCLWQVEKLGSRYWNPTIEINGRIVENMKGRYGPDVFVEFIGDFLKRHRSGPVFVYYPMALVHDPFDPTPDSANRSEKPETHNFPDMVAYMDKVVGQLVTTLEDLGLRDNTLVLFTSDNGTHRSITSRMHGRTIHGGKGLTTDAGTRVPLIASFPGLVPPGRTCDDLVDFSDLFPTLAELTGAAPPKGVVLDGRSFLPQLKGQKGNPREWVYCYYNPRPGNKKFPERCFVRDKRWKLYRNGRLFDVSVDPDEKTPLTRDTDGPARAARNKLQAALDSMPREPVKIKNQTERPHPGGTVYRR